MTTAARREALATLVGRTGTTPANPPILLPAKAYFDLAGEEFRRRLLLTTGSDGGEYCLRPDFTLPLAQDYLAARTGPATCTYSGPVFRQRPSGPAQFDQAGIELIGHEDPDAALTQVFEFALEGLAIYGVKAPLIRLGSVALFEALLQGLDMPEVWRPRIRHRFGHPEMLGQLIARLPDPHGASSTDPALDRETLVDEIAERMAADGLPPSTGRTAEEIADRLLEKRALATALVPERTIATLTAYLDIAGPLDRIGDEIAALAGPAAKALAPALAALGDHALALRERAPKAKLVFDAGFAPRLDYYTGLVFEMAGADGALLASGGQYDRLMQRLGATAPIPAAGCALWVDRLDEEAGK